MVGRDGDALKFVEPQTGLQIEQVHAQWIKSQLEQLPEAHRFRCVEVQPKLLSSHSRQQLSSRSVGADLDTMTIRISEVHTVALAARAEQ